jgi:LysM repeat protein
VEEGTPTPTPLPPLSISQATAAPLGQSGFITPRLPLGFLTPDTPAPTNTLPPGVTPQGPPTSTPSGLITPTSLPGVDDPCLYTVESGDSMFAIAISYDVSLAELLAVNPELDADNPVIFPGDRLRLPTEGCFEVTPQVAPPVNTLTPLIIGTQTGPAEPLPDATENIDSPFGGAQASPTPAQQIYVVRSGDSLFTIATQYGTTVQAIVEANNLTNPNALDIGQELIIPAGD